MAIGRAIIWTSFGQARSIARKLGTDRIFGMSRIA